jgi:hypothetical protein
MEYNDTPRTDAFTQGCRDLIRTFTYEGILACTVYASPMLFLVGPASIIASHPLIVIVLHGLIGFVLSWTIHGVGHRLLTALPKASNKIYLSHSLCVPPRLTLSQFVWSMELLVGAGVFCGILGKRVFTLGDVPSVVAAASLFAVGLTLYFIPVYLGRLWTEWYYPALALTGPTEDVINKSFPGLRSFFK